MLEYLGRNNREWQSWELNLAKRLTLASSAFRPEASPQ
jgi:hypothetical protein